MVAAETTEEENEMKQTLREVLAEAEAERAADALEAKQVLDAQVAALRAYAAQVLGPLWLEFEPYVTGVRAHPVKLRVEHPELLEFYVYGVCGGLYVSSVSEGMPLDGPPPLRPVEKRMREFGQFLLRLHKQRQNQALTDSATCKEGVAVLPGREQGLRCYLD